MAIPKKAIIFSFLTCVGIPMLLIGYNFRDFFPSFRPPPSFRSASGISNPTTIEEIAAVALVEWAVNKKPLPELQLHCGSGASSIRFIVVCDFVPDDLALSLDDRIFRVTREDRKSAFRHFGYGDTTYIDIHKIKSAANSIDVSVSSSFGFMGGVGYTLHFSFSDDGEFQVTGSRTWIS
ncbi:MAG: hypothetical protein AAF591_23400 [Verrucomicrobiota bacterium]